VGANGGKALRDLNIYRPDRGEKSIRGKFLARHHTPAPGATPTLNRLWQAFAFTG